jgi:hypothetical protein
MILYHGTDLESAKNICKGVDFKRSSLSVDFYAGFYTTDNKYLAIKWAERKTLFCKKCSTAAVVSFMIPNDFFSEDGLKVRMFKTTDLEWAQFIVNNRLGMNYINNLPYHLQENNTDLRYDICIGPIADGKISRICGDINVLKKSVDDKILKELISKDYGTQYSFHTDKTKRFLSDMRLNLVKKGELKSC